MNRNRNETKTDSKVFHLKAKLVSAILISLLLIQLVSISAIAESEGTTLETSVTVIINSTPTPTPTSSYTISSGSSGSSSSGSGGVGVVSDECLSNIIRKETRENDLRAGSYTTYRFNSDIPVYEVLVKGLTNEHDVALRVEALKDISCKLTDKPQGRIYQYINIFSGVRQDGVRIRFKVETTWITDGTITLLRWQDGAWNDLNALQTGSDTKYTYFEAYSGGFSQFVIVDKEKTAASSATSRDTVTAGQVQPTAQTGQNAQNAQILPGISESILNSEGRGLIEYIILPLILFLFLGATVVYIMMKRRKKHWTLTLKN